METEIAEVKELVSETEQYGQNVATMLRDTKAKLKDLKPRAREQRSKLSELHSKLQKAERRYQKWSAAFEAHRDQLDGLVG